MNQVNFLRNWLPYKLIATNGKVNCRWLYIEEKTFSEPFFDETISKCKSLEFNSKYFTPVSNLNILAEWAKNTISVKPTAFIFHVSRCGSTLLSQLLGINEKHIVLSEVPFFDELLRLPFKNLASEDLPTKNMLKEAIQFYGQKRTGNETNLFIKTDSWHVFFWKEFRKLYPEVPFILLYRSPDEVINSHQKIRGMQAVPSVIEPEVFGFDKGGPVETDLNKHMAKVLERYFTTFLNIAESDKLSLLVNYNEGIIPLIQKIADFTNLIITSEEKAKMEERSRYHAKFPGQVFSEKQAPDSVVDYMHSVVNLYQQLEIIRKDKSECLRQMDEK